MNPTQAHRRLDALGALDDAQNPGTYALAVAVPDAVDAVQRDWLTVRDTPLPDAYATQLARADAVRYVGASGDVYSRLMDHARGDVRKAALLEAFAMTDVVGVWPGDASGVAERNRARELSDERTAVWTDGELF